MQKCPYCGLFAEKLTRDHIIPRAWGGTNRIHYDVPISNIRMCCQPCNSLRGAVGHCVGAMAAIRMIPGHMRSDAGRQMTVVARSIEPPRWLWWRRQWNPARPSNYPARRLRRRLCGRRIAPCPTTTA